MTTANCCRSLSRFNQFASASEFHSEALQRGCDTHGIRIEYRPIAQPHFGGIVERVIGTMIQLIHQLPSTTFSNIAERGNYPSEKKATLTLAELEHWLTIAITDYYHQKIHSGIEKLLTEINASLTRWIFLDSRSLLLIPDITIPHRRRFTPPFSHSPYMLCYIR